MKKSVSTLISILAVSLVGLSQNLTLATATVAAGNIAQGSTNNIVYAVRMDVTSLPVTVNSMQFTVTGTNDNNDLTVLHVYFNPTAPTIAGATQKAVNVSANFAAPHSYNAIFNLGSQGIAAGASGYFIVVADVAAAATSGNTLKINGLTDPATFGYSSTPTVTNNQTDIAGIQTISAAGVTLTTSALAAANITQGTTNNILYAVKMDVASFPVVISSIQFTLTGTHDNDDLTVLHVFFNPTAPTIAGATQKAVNVSANFAAPHSYNAIFNLGNQGVAAGASGYFIIVADVAAAATTGNTIKINGLTNPVGFGFSTAPTITNNQTDIAGTQTILAAGVTLTTSALAAANITQGTNNNIVYAVRMDVASLPVTVNSIQFTLTGTHDNNDITVLQVFFNPTAPTVVGATQKAANVSANFAAPHTYNAIFNLGNQAIAAGASGYFIIVADVDAAATSGNTIKVNGLANPVSFGYTTSPTITNNQTDISGTQTILAAGVTLTTSAISAGNITQGTVNNIVYVVRMDVASLPVTVSSIQFTLSGTHDDNDLVVLNVLFNPTAPTVAGATQRAVNVSANFAAPHTYNVVFNLGNQAIAAGASGYFIIVADLAATATTGNTVKINGLTNPVSFGYTTSPGIANNQTDIAGAQTITGALPLTLVSFAAIRTNAQTVMLQWTTTSEINTKHFEVEWSSNGHQFITIAVVAAAGNSTQTLQYNNLHTQPVSGNNFYRLKMVDVDGRFTYSPVVRIHADAALSSIKIFPNPFANILQFTLQSEKNEAVVYSLYNIEGKLMASLKAELLKGTNLLRWNVFQLTPGTYFLSSTSQGFETLKILKQ